VYTSIAPTLITLINFIIIPTIIDAVSYYLNYSTHSQRHFANFYKLLVFLLFVTLFIPLLGLASFDELFGYFNELYQGSEVNFLD
jgi:hypothetical protein